MKAKGILFGLNYDDNDNARLKGCINDVQNLKSFLNEKYNISLECFTDDLDKINTSYNGIISKLYELAIDSYRKNLDYVFISYSGHGTSVTDYNNDENDYKDEALVPSDFMTKGVIVDDILQSIISLFNPITKIVVLIDACHSGTMIDIKYKWNSSTSVSIENIACSINSRVIYISGCEDFATSSDCFNFSNKYKYSGALTSSFLQALKEVDSIDIFVIIDRVRKILKEKGFSQIPQMSSTYNLYKDPRLFPI